MSNTQRGPASRVGIREVASRAGVAVSSVSRVLSDHPDVSERMRAKVMEAVDDLGYRPDMLAQSMRRRVTMSVGFAASDISNPVLAETVKGAEHVLRGAGYSMLVTDAERDSGLDLVNLEVLQQRRVDGLLLSISDERSPAIRDLLSELEMPMVLVDRDIPEGVDAPGVFFDHREGMREAAEHLWGLRHRRVALISGGPQRPARERRLGVEDVFKRPGGSLEELSGPFTIEFGRAAVARAMLGMDPPPTAIIAGGNLMMRGALRELRSMGLVVGRDVSFVGCDDVAVAEFHEPPISLVRRSPQLSGEVAARVLVSMLTGGDRLPAEDLVLPTEFIARPSVGPA